MASQQYTLERMSPEDIAAMEAQQAAEFQSAVEEWRASKAAGCGDAVIVEAGGAFAARGEAGSVDAAAAPMDSSELSKGSEGGGVGVGVGGDDGQDYDDDNDNDDDGDIDFGALEGALSPAALAALRCHVDEKISAGSVGGMPAEDFGMSQFWWDDASSDALGREALRELRRLDQPAAGPGQGAGDTGAEGAPRRKRRIGVLSGPSVWFGLDRLLSGASSQEPAARDAHPFGAAAAALTAASDPAVSADPAHATKPWGPEEVEVVLLEFDKRFGAACGGAYHFYDYNDPIGTLPHALHGSCDYLVAGPPYVSDGCIGKYEEAFDLLAATGNTPRAIVIGASLEEALARRGYTMDEHLTLAYKSKFCTPMRLFRK